MQLLRAYLLTFAAADAVGRCAASLVDEVLIKEDLGADIVFRAAPGQPFGVIVEGE